MIALSRFIPDRVKKGRLKNVEPNPDNMFLRWYNDGRPMQPNDGPHLDCDTTNPEDIARFLSQYRTPDGQLLQRTSRSGEPLRYKLWYFGAPNKHLKKMNILFPGYDQNGKKLDVLIYGKWW